MISRYLTAKKHDYANFNCFHIIQQIYWKELGIDLSYIWKEIPLEKISSDWMKKVNFNIIDKISSKYNWKKISFPEIEKYDIIVFKKNNLISHFGVYIGQNKMFHVEESCSPRPQELDDSWRQKIYGIYRCGMKNI